MNTDINFPNLHIYLKDVGKSIDVLGISVAYYGIIIAVGMLLGILIILHRSRKAGISEDTGLDVCIYSLLFGIVGARLYYVIFEWEIYKNDLLQIFNLRQGGLAIYGGVLVGMSACMVVCRRKKIAFLKMADVVIPGVLVGQILGRWGNFFNREVFGGYTDGLFAMELPLNAVRSMEDITQEMIEHGRMVGEVMYVQVHPTFLYESVWNLVLLVFLLWYTKRKKFDGELFLDYLFFYGVGRFWIEGVRTDQLKLWGTQLPVSQVLAVVMMVVSAVLYFYLRFCAKYKRKEEKI